jgi:hypothetical protein
MSFHNIERGDAMLSKTIEFASLLSAALLAGSLFGVWLMLNPAGLDARAYVQLQQRAIRTLNTAMPRLGAAAILMTVLAAIAVRADRLRLGLLIGTVVCFVTAGLVTRFLNQPINAVVMTWSSDAVPAGWEGLRDAWWRWHLVRLAAGVVGLSLLLGATLVRTVTSW